MFSNNNNSNQKEMSSRLIYPGGIKVICGPMFSGKTDELLKQLNRFKYAKIPFITFKPTIDKRSKNKLVSRDGRKIETFEISKPEEIINYLNDEKYSDIQVIAIDEVQFLDESIVDLVSCLSKMGFYIIVSGLDKDFRGLPFGPIPKLLSISDEVRKLTAICTICGNHASFSQRLINEKPAKFDDPIILIGNTESYEARCRDHFEFIPAEKTEIEKIIHDLKFKNQ